MSDDTSEVSEAFSNVFEALGLPDPDIRQSKNLARIAVGDAIAARGLSQRAAAKLIGIPQPNLARALSGSSDCTTLDQWFRYWTALGGHVQISFLPGEGITDRGLVVAEGPGMLLAQRERPPAEAPAPASKPRRVAESTPVAKASIRRGGKAKA